MSKILVIGDSISYGKWDSNGGWVARLRRYIDENFNIGKSNNFQVYNLGIPGDVVPRIAQRIENEILMRIPKEEKTNDKNLILFAAGINDSCPNNWMTGKQTSEAEFKDALLTVINTAKRMQCSLLFVGLTPVNSERSKGLQFSNEEVRKYDRFILDVCSQNLIPMITLFDELEKSQFSEFLIDAVHPSNEGHAMLADKIIAYLKDNNFFTSLLS